MKKTAPVKESGLEVMQAQFSRKVRSIARVELVSARPRMYLFPVTVNPVADLGRSNTTRRTSAHHPIAGAFFVPAVRRYGGLRGDTFGCAGLRVSRSANPSQSVTISCLAADGDGSTTYGAPPMQHIRKLRAAAHRRMALAALRADSSLRTRLTRYQHHITKARALEAVGGE